MGRLVASGTNPPLRKNYARTTPEPWGPQPKRSPFHLLAAPIIHPDKFAWDDLAQQIVGAMVLSAPIAVTEEVWRLSAGLDIARLLAILGVTILFNILLLYYTKYQLVESERIFGIIPTRLSSQLLVSYSTAAVMLYLMGVLGGVVTGVGDSIQLVVFVGLFANIGAGAADLLK